MPKDCPPEVIECGKALILARKRANSMSGDIDEALAKLEGAIEAMKPHGAKRMQAGEAIVLLRKAQAAQGFIMQAHNSLRHVLNECDVAEPTDVQVASIR
jgi:hypothetical protein